MIFGRISRTFLAIFRHSMDNDEDIVRDDQVKNPNCRYSVSFTKSCSDKDGSFVCESIKNITRLCPNSRPVSIYSKRMKTDSKAEDEFGSDQLPGFPFPGQSSGQFPDINDVFRQLERARRQQPGHPGETPSTADSNGIHDENDYEDGFKSLCKRFGFGSGGRKPSGGEGKGSGPTGSTSSEGGPKLPPGRTSGPSEDI